METNADNRLMQYQSLFWTPHYVEPTSAWIEHIPFAFWLIEVVRPKVMVELGVHAGTSYFSFCQAVKRINCETVCYGVDTWQGDEHAGYYGDEVFERVENYNSKEYPRFSTLIRSTFDEAKDYFIDKSIDLLHIDGLHTYEAVKHDFEVWLPKLSTAGLVIFHDINVREKNFGVFKLWEELKQQYRNFQFDFGHGLGILSVGNVIPDELKELFDENRKDYHVFLGNIFSERGNFFKVTAINDSLLQQQKKDIASLKEINGRLNESYRILDSHHTQIRESHKLLEAQILQLQEDHNRLKERYYSLEFANNQAKEKYDQDIDKLLSEQKETNSSLREAIKKNESFTKDINWYRETYENRSLLGVLKEKIQSLLKKKLRPEANQHEIRKPPALVLHSNRFRLIPANDLKLSDDGLCITFGNDPFFFVDLHGRTLRRGWYRLHIDISELKETLNAPKLYYDYGSGFNEEDIWNLPTIKNDKIECLIECKNRIKRLRFDPTTTEATFAIRNFELKHINKFRAFSIAAWERRNATTSDATYRSVFGELAGIVLKSGLKGIDRKIRDSVSFRQKQMQEAYTNWCALYDTISESQLDIIKSRSNSLAYKPLFSIIMPVHNAPVSYLRKAIESVLKQGYENWQLCIADDKSTNKDVIRLLKKYQSKEERIKIIFRETNGHISQASNSALELATGDYIVLLDQDDELPAHCLYMVAKALNENENVEMIYSDEDKIDEQGNRFDPYFKTDWNKDLFYGQNMISHLGVYKHSLLKRIKGFREGYEGSQDYDLALRCLEYLKPEQIHHIPHILYHWRAVEGSTSVKVSNKTYAIKAGMQALKNHLNRTGQNADVEENVNNSYRVKWRLSNPSPMVSIIIPTKNKADILSTCIGSILEKTQYKNFEILIIDNSSEDVSALEYFKTIRNNYKEIRILEYKSEFNFSAIANYGVQQSKGDIIVLMNNDTEVINSNWLCEMVSQCGRDEIGVVGAKLYYPNGQIQHAGVFLFEGHPGNHIYHQKHKDDPGYFNKLNLVQNYSAVTAACLAVRKAVYMEAGGFDEKNLKIAYNDVDFCLKVGELGYRNLWTPFAELIHHESLSRGSDMDETNFIRFKSERNYMLAKWRKIICNDPFFNPNLGPDTRTDQLAFPPRVKYQWQ